MQMTEEQLTSFLEAIKNNATLQAKLKSAADIQAVIAVAKEAGFDFSAEDLKRAVAELSDEELENINLLNDTVEIFWCNFVNPGKLKVGTCTHNPDC